MGDLVKALLESMDIAPFYPKVKLYSFLLYLALSLPI